MHGDVNDVDAYGAWMEAALEPFKEPMARLSEPFPLALCDAPVQRARIIAELFVAASRLADSPPGRVPAARVARGSRGAEGDAFHPVTQLAVIEHRTACRLDEVGR